jgi:hypothetical protein
MGTGKYPGVDGLRRVVTGLDGLCGFLPMARVGSNFERKEGVHGFFTGTAMGFPQVTTGHASTHTYLCEFWFVWPDLIFILAVF